MVRLGLKLFVRRNEEEDWAAASVALYYDAATLQELCEQIRDALFQGGCIALNDGVKVDSFFGFVSERWHKVSRFEDIQPEAMLRIVLRDGAAGPTGSGQKRGFDAVDGGAEETGLEPKRAKFAQDDGAAEPTGSGQKRGFDAVDGGAEIVPADDGTAKPTGKKLKTGESNNLKFNISFICIPTQKPPLKCVHGRQRNLCKDCGGASVCSHGRR